MRILAYTALLPAAATFYFLVFWRWFDFWRRHRVATYALMFASVVGLGLAIHLGRGSVFAGRLPLPVAVKVLGWLVVVVSVVFGSWADRQIGLRVRSFTPFFETHGRIRLVTSGAYAVVRHPIYASGIFYQLGVFGVSGFPSVLVAGLVFGLGALWFTRQEERRLVALLDDPSEYERYRARVPALVPRFGRARRRGRGDT
ncbi:MAG: hypothetical protein KC609_15320 [Myxococcales bacterium]|nr:hypothetical protein [Myxococcales bacterium]